MPDFERVIDRFRADSASDSVQAGWARGYCAGKSRARIEVVVIAVILLAGWFVLIGR